MTERVEVIVLSVGTPAGLVVELSPAGAGERGRKGARDSARG